MQQIYSTDTLLLLLALAWTVPWKGVALWKAAQRKDLWWFIAILILNTMGILEILYVFIFSKWVKKETHHTEHHHEHHAS